MILFSRWICSCNASSNCFNCCKTKRKLAQASSGAVNPLVNEEIFSKTFSFVIMFIFHHFDGIQNGAAMEFSYFQAFLFGLEHFINIRK